MELFDEVKNRYFHIVFTVLNECVKGLSKEDIIKIVDKEEFKEKIIDKDFKTFEGLLLNEYGDRENYNLLKKKDELYYLNINGEKGVTIPVRLTNIEKAWLKNLLEQPDLQLFLKGSTIEKLKAALKEVSAPKINEIIETKKSALPIRLEYSLDEPGYSKEPIILEVTDKKAAMERCFMSFSEMERYSRCIEEDKYEVKLFYYTFEEEEIIRKILALGPYVKVIWPQRIVDEVVKRIRRALALNGCDFDEGDENTMIELKGKYNTAKVYTDKLETEVISQVIELCNQEFCKDARIAIMPDTHAGKGCVIGFTANLGDRVIPNIVGVDIGCGMTTVELGKMDIDLKKLDEVIRKWVPSGMQVHEGRTVKFPKLQELHCYRDLTQTKRIEKSIGTLGGGNHFIELDVDDEGNIYLVIHSGSRNLGKQVAELYQSLAIDLCSGKEDYFEQRDRIISEYKKEDKRNLIQAALKELKARYDKLLPSYPRDLCFLTGKYKDRYLHDMSICQEYAALNRETMANNILEKLLSKRLEDFSYFHTVHNYINFKDNIIRKGSISAYEGEKVLIPINMRDGSIVAVGKGNPDWNYSAPHGAGRLMSRSKAKESLTLEEYEKSMDGIFTTSVNQSTLDEAPMAYKPMEEIINNIHDTVEILKVIKPIYNFKAGE